MKYILILISLISSNLNAESEYEALNSEFSELPSQNFRSETEQIETEERIRILLTQKDIQLNDTAIIAKGKRNCAKQTAKYTMYCTDQYLVKTLTHICKLELSKMTLLNLDPRSFHNSATRNVSISTINKSGKLIECREL